MSTLLQAVRGLLRARAFAAAAIGTLALGIGASTAIFSVVDAALLKPLPYPDADRMVALAVPGGGDQSGQVYLRVRERAAGFETIAAQGGGSGWSLTTGRTARWVSGLRVSAGYFDAHGVQPLRGRGFTAAEDQPGGPNAVVIGEDLWEAAFGRAGVLGQVVALGTVDYTVVGIMPRAFRSIPDVDVWTPLRTTSRDNGWNYRVVGRLAAGVSPAQALAGLADLRADLQQQFPRENQQRLASLTWTPYRDHLGRGSRTTLLLLMGAVAFLLLVACVNVAGLQLARAVARQRELATRAAIGGSGWHIVRPMLAEAMVLASAGAVGGVALAAGLVAALPRLVSETMFATLMSGETPNINARVLATTLGLSVASGLFFGVAPAVVSARLTRRGSLNEGARGTMGQRTMWLRRAFSTAQVALAMVLLVGAGLLGRTLLNLTRTDLGFDPRNVTVARMSLQSGAARTTVETEAWFQRTIERLESIPTVQAVAAANNAPVERGLNIALAPPPGSQVDRPRAVDFRYVTEDYFDVLGIPVRSGRVFDDRDRAGGEQVAIVNEAFARAYFGRTAVVGELASAPTPGQPPRVIVGVIGDVKARSGSGWTRGLTALGTPAAPTVYVPLGQAPQELLQTAHRFFPITWLIKASPGNAALTAQLEQALQTVAPEFPVVRLDPMSTLIAADLDLPRFLTALVGAFAATAMMLAAIGLYGVVAYSVTQRTREVGIRMALGATSRRVLTRFVKEGLVIGSLGAAIGAVGALQVTSLLEAWLFGVTSLDRTTFLAVSGLLIVVAAAASLVPATRAARLEPTRALRAD